MEDIRTRQLLSYNLALPDGSINNIGMVVALGKLNEVTAKKWVLLEKYLGDGWKNLENGHVNFIHTGKLLGSVKNVTLTEDGELQAAFSLSRRALDEYDIPSDASLLKHFAVSVEWVFNPSKSFASINGVEIPLLDALKEGYVVLKKGPLGNSEIVPNPNKDEEILIYPADISFTDIALLDRRMNPPNFSSARVLAHTNSAESITSKVHTAVWDWANKNDTAPYVGSLQTIPDNIDMTSGRVYATLLDDTTRITLAYNMNSEGGVELHMKNKLASPFEAAFIDMLLNTNKIGEKESGHKSPPKEYADLGATDRSDYADPTNYKYPVMDEKHAKAALTYFSQSDNRSEYTAEEQKTIARKIISACRAFKVEVDPDGEVAKIAGYNIMDSEPNMAYCAECGTVVELNDFKEVARDDFVMLVGKCAAGHDVQRFASSMITEELLNSLAQKALNAMYTTISESATKNVTTSIGEDGKEFKTTTETAEKTVTTSEYPDPEPEEEDEEGESGSSASTADDEKKDDDVEKRIADAVNAAIAQYNETVLPQKIEEALAKKESEAKLGAWVNTAFETLEQVLPIAEEKKQELIDKLTGMNMDEDKFAIMVAERKAEAAEAIAIAEKARADELEAKIASSMNSTAGPIVTNDETPPKRKSILFD